MKSRNEIASLTGLRGLAALLVVINHYCYWTSVTPAAALPVPIERWTSTAGIGMAIFFTLSGYVIALSYSHWDWRQRPAFNLARLFFYRFARLYPAYFVFVILAILIYPDLQSPDKKAFDYLAPHLLLAQSWFPVKFDGVPASAGHFHLSWSLSVECALYLAFGLGAVLMGTAPLWRHRALWVGALFFLSAGILIPLAWSNRDLLMPAGWSDKEWSDWLLLHSPYGVAIQFGLGVVAYRLSALPLVIRFSRAASNVGGIGLIAIYLAIATDRIYEQYVIAQLASLATALLMIGSTSSTVANRLLSGRAIIYIGTVSYSLYLFHFMLPPLALHGRFFATFDATAAAFHAVNFVASLALAIIFATGVYHLVEVPGRRAIRAAADRLLGIRRRPMEQGLPAE